MKILIVEDEVRLCDNIARHLSQEGYTTQTCYHGEEALALLHEQTYDAIVLDIMLPGVDGITILETLRSRKLPTPVILLTAMTTIADRIRGLDAGADDYLTKPFSLEELSARLRALLRRQTREDVSVLSVGDLTLDTRAKTACRSGKTISLTAKEYAILEYLLLNKGIVITREQMLGHIWNNDYEITSNIVDVYIRTLRRKIDDGHEPKLIQTLRGIGYCIKEEPAT